MTPIAAGSVVVAQSSFAPIEFEADRLKLGVCESAVPPVAPTDFPTNVVIAWEDGTRTVYATTDGRVLLQVAPPATSSLLSSYVAINSGLAPLNVAGRYGGIVIGHFSVADERGAGNGEVVMVRTPVGVTVLPALAVIRDPNR